MAEKGGQILETFTLQCHERPEMKAFRKTPSKFASKNTKMDKNRGSFLETFTNTLLLQYQMQPLELPPLRPIFNLNKPIFPFVVASRRLVMTKTVINNLLVNI